MAKDKKNKKPKVPKQIGGVKVPKKVRKAGNKALELADHPAALELAAAALTAAAAALQAKGRTRRAEEVTPHLARMAKGQEEGRAAAADPIHEAAARLGDVIRAAAMDGARRILERIGEPAPPAAGEAASPEEKEEEPAPKPKRKKANGGPAAAEADSR